MDLLTFFLELLKIITWPLVVLYIVRLFKFQIAEIIKRITHVKTPAFEATVAQEKQEAVAEEISKSAEKKSKQLEQKNIDLEKHLEGRPDYMLLYLFERIYRIIFPSQIKLLTMLNEDKKGLILDNVRSFYESTNWKDNYPFEKYVGFLENAQLISKMKTKYTLTILGEAFLLYLEQNEIPFDKPPVLEEFIK